MKAVRSHDYRIDGYGKVNFIKLDIGSGHSTYKVFWRREGAENGTRIAWLKEGLKPSAKLALFFCKNACSLEDGHDEHYYYDKGLEPPKRIPLMRFTRFHASSSPHSPLLAAWPPLTKRAVQARERPLSALSQTREVFDHAKVACMPCKSTVSRSGNSTAITSPQAGAKLELPSDHYRPVPGPASPVTGKPAYSRSPRLSLWHAARPQSKKTPFLACPGRIVSA